jgi:hypothetical protein
MSITFDIIEKSDIMVFLNDNSKADNDTSNNTREGIISTILSITDDYLLDEQFGCHWSSIREKLEKTLTNLCAAPFHHIRIERKGGMGYNYDFVVTYENVDKSPVYSLKLEFKHNNSNVKDLVQFLELYDRDCKSKFELFDYSYSEFYYDNFLDEYLAIDGMSIVKPDKATYLKHVYDIKYKHPFFKMIYDNKTNNKKEKDKLVDVSRTQFIEKYVSQFKFDKITEKIKESQTNKIFLLWDKNEFHIEKLDVENIIIVGIKPNSIHKLYFDVQVDNFIYNIRIRLNWGNNNGIANPRWKFSFIDK